NTQRSLSRSRSGPDKNRLHASSKPPSDPAAGEYSTQPKIYGATPNRTSNILRHTLDIRALAHVSDHYLSERVYLISIQSGSPEGTCRPRSNRRNQQNTGCSIPQNGPEKKTDNETASSASSAKASKTHWRIRQTANKSRRP
ncbi:hypothetical protein BASA60_005156, partial [Batrachochytrium salamandrivorans]